MKSMTLRSQSAAFDRLWPRRSFRDDRSHLAHRGSVEKFVGKLFGLVEFAGMDEVDGSVG